MDYFINVSLIQTYQVSLLDKNPEITAEMRSVDDALEDQKQPPEVFFQKRCS